VTEGDLYEFPVDQNVVLEPEIGGRTVLVKGEIWVGDAGEWMPFVVQFINEALPDLIVSLTGTGSGTVTSSPSGINCGSDCSETYNYNTSVTLTASASTGSTFAGWSGGSGSASSCSGTGNCEFNLTQNSGVTATFTLATHTITASAVGVNGSISPSGAVSGVNHGTSQSFTVTPSSGYQAVMYGTCGGNLVGSTYTTNPITADCSVTANFNPTGSNQTLPPGDNVQVSVPVSLPSGGTGTVTITFDQIDTGGTLSVVATDTPPSGEPPTGFRFLGTYYEVTFTGGTFSGYLYITLPYDSSIPAGREGQLTLFHRESTGGGWYDCTYSLDTVNNKITGRVTSLSPFGAGYPTGAITGANTYMIIVLAFIAISTGVFLIRKRRQI
jgi:hypothetical protein